MNETKRFLKYEKAEKESVDGEESIKEKYDNDHENEGKKKEGKKEEEMDVDEEDDSENEEDDDSETEENARAAKSHLEHLQMQQKSLENKIDQLEEKLSSIKVRKTMKDSYRLQISNAEQKQKMLAKRIAYEKNRANLRNSETKTLTTLSKVSGQFLYLNGLSSKHIQDRKRNSGSCSIKEDFFDRECEEIDELEDYGKWKRLNAHETDKIDRYKLVISRGPKVTTNFFPPIPAPSAKKRPKSPLEPEPVNNGEELRYSKKENILRIIPNSRRVAQNRAFMYEKQLEFASKYGLETKEILENLADSVASIQRGSTESTTDVSRQQLFLMGALSREFLDEDDVTVH